MAESIKIDFTAEYKIEEQSETDYEQSIVALRQKLAEKYSNTNLPILPLQENPPTHWFAVTLRTKDNAITLRIRHGNLCLDGYQMGTGKWLEFGSDTSSSKHLIPGSFFLDFNGDYNSLEIAAGVPRNSINLGQKPLIGAVNTLTTSKESEDIKEKRAKSLIIVIRMIYESIRYARISTNIAKSGFEPKGWMNILESQWGRLSLDLLKSDAGPNYHFQPLPISTTEINTIEQVADIVGIILQQTL